MATLGAIAGSQAHGFRALHAAGALQGLRFRQIGEFSVGDSESREYLAVLRSEFA